MKSEYCVALLTCIAATTHASETNAPNANMRYAALSVQRDDGSNQQALGTLSITLGDHAWVQAGGGQARIEQGTPLHPNIVTAGIGAASNAWQFSVNYADRHDGSVYRQRDWNASIDWHNDVAGIGVDGADRHTHLEGTVGVATSQGGVASVPVSEILSGYGIGMHARFNASERMTLFATAMKYHYNSTTRQSGTTTVIGSSGNNLNTLISNALTNKSLLSQTLTQASIVTRDEAAFDRSFDVGATYRFNKVRITAEYLNDKVLDASGSVATLQVKASINVAPHWTVAPGIGHSRSDQYGGVNYGMVTVAYGW